ncbi:HalOD1 output domain-containing protein [Haloarchaeobius salinus]|uniref:HalOD1 output domain-containing protein n=1 Tax=Haloarchaeobius salinus TaxID=1198298 RepID=UPI00210D9CF5
MIDAIVAVTGTPATELDPLHETIDPDALDRILGAGSGSPARRSNIAVSFSHESCDVTVRADGQVTVRLQTDGL